MEIKLLWICTLICKFPCMCRHMLLPYITKIINFLWHFVHAVVCSVFIIARMTAKSVIFGMWNTILVISCYALLIIHFLQSSQRSSLPCSTLSPHVAHTVASSSSFGVNSFLRAVRFGTSSFLFLFWFFMFALPLAFSYAF